MASLIYAGVDGLIKNYPDRMRNLLADRGYKLPAPVAAPAGRDCVAEVSA
jgi:glycerophosphoryl diester phosphodiesterase